MHYITNYLCHVYPELWIVFKGPHPIHIDEDIDQTDKYGVSLAQKFSSDLSKIVKEYVTYVSCLDALLPHFNLDVGLGN